MHHLNHKDYLFLVFVALLMIFVTGVFWFSWSGVDTSVKNEIAEDLSRSKFQCGGQNFSIGMSEQGISKEYKTNIADIKSKTDILEKSGLGPLVEGVVITNYFSTGLTVSADEGSYSVDVDCYNSSNSFGDSAAINSRIDTARGIIVSDENIKVNTIKLSQNTLQLDMVSEYENTVYYLNTRYIVLEKGLLVLNVLKETRYDASLVDNFFNSLITMDTVVPYTYGDSIYNDQAENNQSNIFDCGEKFYLNQSVSDFYYKNDDNVKPGILKQCMWTKEGKNKYAVIYMQGESAIDIQKFKQSVIDDGTDIFDEIHELGNGFESTYYEQDEKKYALMKVLVLGDKIIILMINFDYKTTLDNPEFRSFVESFRLVE